MNCDKTVLHFFAYICTTGLTKVIYSKSPYAYHKINAAFAKLHAKHTGRCVSMATLTPQNKEERYIRRPRPNRPG